MPTAKPTPPDAPPARPAHATHTDSLAPAAALTPPPTPTGHTTHNAHNARAAERFWPTFMRARLAVVSVLLVLQAMVMVLGTTDSWPSLALSAAHLGAVVGAQRLLKPSLRHGLGTLPWLLTVGVDVLVFAALQVLQHGGLNYTLLFALPVLMSAILGPQLKGLATAAAVTLFMLADATWAVWMSNDGSAPRLIQSAITGTGFFLVALLAHQLAGRLAREEALSQRNQLAARTQVAVNELIIEAMTDGVLVVDERGMVRTINPAAAHMLASPDDPAPNLFLLGTRPHCLPLLAVVQATFEQQAPQQAEVTLEADTDLKRRLRVRTRPTPTRQTGDATDRTRLCVVFLQDLHELEARVRTEKLMAMGRMTVAVAHEIRNPLSAIAQANALLQEDLTDPPQLRLAAMVATHTQRLNRIVDDVLDVVRVPGQPAPHDLAPHALDTAVHSTLGEWSGQHPIGARLAWLGGCPGVAVRFEPEHLRRILVNLLDNANRYASPSAAAIQVSTRLERDGRARVSVWSDGAPLSPSVRQHLFEPFFSSESRNSGMGLYLCRELCERHQATLDCQRSERGGRSGNEFFLRMPVAVANLSA